MNERKDTPAGGAADGFGCAVTGAGLRLIAKAIANEEDLTICRVMMGSGEPPEGVYIGDLEGLSEPVAEGTVSEPVRSGTTISMFVEYRSDMNGGLQEGFIIREFGVFALDGDREVMIYYGSLSKYPQYIGPYTGCQDVRRYPISLTIAEGSQVKLEGLPSVVITLEDMKDYCVTTLLPQLLTSARNQIVSHNQAPEAHPDLRQAVAEARQAAAAAQEAAGKAQDAAEHTAGGCAVELTFAEGTAGQTYTVTGGDGELYSGTIPEGLKVTVTVKKCDTVYTVTTEDETGAVSTNKVVTGPYFGPVKAEVTDFAAVLTVTTSAGALVEAVSGAQRYRGQAGEDGTAVLTICLPGTYAVSASCEAGQASGTVEITESGGAYALTLTKFRPVSAGGSGGQFYRTFEPEDWTDGVLRISAEEHGLTPQTAGCLCALRQRVGRTAADYHEGTAARGRTDIVDCVEAALNANASAPDTYPTAEDGHPQLTWNQVQYFLLEDILAPEETAAAKASELGFDWQDRDTTGAETDVTLDQVLAAAYLPALGGVTTGLDALCTAEVLQGLRLRRRELDAPYGQPYDLNGELVTNTWAALESRAEWDPETLDLVLSSKYAYAGDMLALG